LTTGAITRNVQFEEVAAHHTTFKNDPTNLMVAADIGKAVMLVANGTVGLGWSGGRVKGILKVVEDDGYVVVQDGGYKEEVPYSSLPAVGDRVVLNGAGSVQPVASGSAVGDHEVVDVDTDNEKVILHLTR